MRGRSTVTISIPDKAREDPETFAVTLSRPSPGWSIGAIGTATVVINDND